MARLSLGEERNGEDDNRIFGIDLDMIIKTEGDILLTSAQAIAHAVAPHDHFNQGLALSLREQWPALVKDFRHYCQSRNPDPGSIFVWSGVGGTRVVNLMVQTPARDHHGTPGRAELSHVNHALRELGKWIEKEKVTSIALPRLATGVGGLSWEDVSPLIERHLGELETSIYLYTLFKKGVKGNEPPSQVRR